MNMCRKHSAWAIAGLLLTLTIGSPVWADDVELLLSTPGASTAAKPNILFIIDSSGSMTRTETTQEPYDPDVDYTSGPCDTNMYYWSTTSAIPTCGWQYKFKKSRFHCDQGRDLARASGSYTDTMAQYYSYSGKAKWRQPYRTLQDSDVECKADSAIHGSNSDPSGARYARRGTNRAKWTNNASREVDWGVSPTHRIITVYDSNWLNWFYNPPGTSMRRTDIVKQVTKNVLGSLDNVNVGFMRFNWSQGGPIIHAIKDLDDNRNEANAIVDAIPASGWTPLSETLYEAALYWRGMTGHYGNADDTDEDAMESQVPVVYKQPAEYACAKNFQVLLTDGDPTQDTDAYTRVPTLPNYNAVTGRSTCTGPNIDGACLDDVAEYLHNADINPSLPGKQSVATYTIGFSDDLALETTQLLKDTAILGGGEYYPADDVQSLTVALTDIVTNIFDKDISFTAPALAVNAFNRTQHLNDLYVSVFRAADEVHWPGNLKKYTLKDGTIKDKLDLDAVDPDTGFFDKDATNFWNDSGETDGTDVYKGGAANLIVDPFTRDMYTNNTLGDLTNPINSLSAANVLAFLDGVLGLTGAVGEPTEVQLIDWARGVDIQDEDNDGNTIDDVRSSLMGDTLHAQPAAVVYGDTGGNQDIIVFTATNDGYLHAFDTDTAEELWSFIPRELLPNLRDLYFNENVDYKLYGLDGDIVPIVSDVNNDGVIEVGTDFVYLVFGMRRGGDNYYMLDVTDPDKPYLKWIKTFDEMGQSWSRPTAAKVDIDGTKKVVLILGAGYDSAHDTAEHPDVADSEGAGIYMLDLETGAKIWRVGPDLGAELTLAEMTRSIPSQIRVIDMSGDGLADRMYASDLGGQIWRFDITNGAVPANLVVGGVFARLGAEGLSSPTIADTRRFYTPPDVAMFTDKAQDRRYLSISIGSGYRAHPLDNRTTDRFYSIRDAKVFTPMTEDDWDNHSIITESNLVEVQGQLGTVIPATSAGWKFTLPPTEKVLAGSRTFNDSIYFVTFEPETVSSDPCQAGLSVNRLYRMSVHNGDPVIDYAAPVPTDPEEIDEERVTKLEQGGIAPVPVFLFPGGVDENCTGEECLPPEPIGCVGVECFDPDFPNNPVRTLWTQDGIE